MYRKLEAVGYSLLGLFVPKVEAAATSSARQCWKACWQCDSASGGDCRCNAPCCTSDGGKNYECNCLACP